CACAAGQRSSTWPPGSAEANFRCADSLQPRWRNPRFPQRAKLAEPPSAHARTPARAGLWPACLRTDAGTVSVNGALEGVLRPFRHNELEADSAHAGAHRVRAGEVDEALVADLAFQHHLGAARRGG